MGGAVTQPTFTQDLRKISLKPSFLRVLCASVVRYSVVRKHITILLLLELVFFPVFEMGDAFPTLANSTFPYLRHNRDRE